MPDGPAEAAGQREAGLELLDGPAQDLLRLLALELGVPGVKSGVIEAPFGHLTPFIDKGDWISQHYPADSPAVSNSANSSRKG